MQLSKKQKIILGVVGVAVVGIASYFLFFRKKADDEIMEISEEEIDSAVKSAESGTGTGTGTTTKPSCSGYTMGYLSYREGGKHPVHFASPRPPKGTFNANDKVRISNTGSFDGDYTVSSVWIDSAGNVGAIYLPISYTPTGKSDRTFEGKGCITKI